MDIEVVAENAYARKVNVKVPAARVREALEKAYRDVLRKARLPGFRQGKVPRNVLEARFGPSISQDVAGELVQQGWVSAIARHQLEPVSRPSVVEQGEIEAGADFTFTIDVEVKPTIEAKDYTGLQVYWPESEVTDDEVAEQIEARRQGQARLTSIDDRAVEVGDTVQVELTVRDGDEIVLQEPGTLVRTQGEGWLAGVESLLTGMSVDEEKTGEVTFSETARNEDVKGRTLQVTAKVLSIQTLAAPDLDDALATELGYESVADMREKVRAELSKGRAESAKNQARANLLEKLIEANPFDVPRGMIDSNLQMLADELAQQEAWLGRDPKDLRFTQSQVDELRRRAAFAARGGLLLESVWTLEQIEVTEEDVEARLQRFAEERNQPLEAVRGWFHDDEAKEDLRGRIREEKTLDWLLDRAEVSHEPPAAEAPAVEAAADEAPAAEAPAKPKRASKKKAAEAAPAADEGAPAAEAKPKASRKKKAVEAAPAADEKAPAAEAKPKRSRKKAAAEEPAGE